MEKPILFNTEMVRAILDGRKTQTRRLVKPQPVYNDGFWELGGAGWSDVHFPIHPVQGHSLWNRQPVKPGDILWVRETWNGVKLGRRGKEETFYWYRADEDDERLNPDDKWRPSIHMPREAARLFLRVKEVSIQRLQDMTTADAEKEGAETNEWLELCEEAGVVGLPTWSLREFFGYHVWNRTISGEENLGRYGWDANPWVWVIEFERLDEKPAGLWADRDTAQFGDQDKLMPAT